MQELIGYAQREHNIQTQSSRAINKTHSHTHTHKHTHTYIYIYIQQTMERQKRNTKRDKQNQFGRKININCSRKS